MIAILGAGISGLNLAYELEKRGVPYQLLEQSDQAGGALFSRTTQDLELEYGPNSLFYSQALRRLVRELQLEEQIVEAEDVSSNRYILKEGKLRALPSKPQQLLTSSFFSVGTRLGALKEWFHPKEDPERESVASFFERHFNREVVDYAVQPFLAGIYGGSADKLQMGLTFPQLQDYAQEYGSLLKAMAKNKPKRRSIISFKGGTQTLSQHLADKVSYLHLNTPVEAIRKSNGLFHVVAGDKILEAETIVSTLPAYTTAELLSQFEDINHHPLNKVNYVPVWVVHLSLKKEAVPFDFNGFGALYPPKEGLQSMGTIWNSSVFPTKAPEGQVLTTTLAGGYYHSDLGQRGAEEVKIRIVQELKEIYGFEDHAIDYIDAYLWPRAIPQYDRQMYDALDAANNLEDMGYIVLANWRKGLSVPDCLEKSRSLAIRLANKEKTT